MASFNIVCGGPGPHVPASGILGTSDKPPTADVRCSSASCVKPEDVTVTNQRTLQQQAQAALISNRTYIALAAPTTAQTTAQVKALTQQMQAVMRMALGQFDATN